MGPPGKATVRAHWRASLESRQSVQSCHKRRGKRAGEEKQIVPSRHTAGGGGRFTRRKASRARLCSPSAAGSNVVVIASVRGGYGEALAATAPAAHRSPVAKFYQRS